MFKDNYIQNLIQRMVKCPKDMSNNEIIELYKEVQNVLKSLKYGKKDKIKIKKEGQLESLTMIYDGIKDSTY
ncbi:MAG: hypothetical protein ACI4UX_01270 [Clostridia bacterium]